MAQLFEAISVFDVIGKDIGLDAAAEAQDGQGGKEAFANLHGGVMSEEWREWSGQR